VVKVKGTARYKMRSASWIVRATDVTQHNDTQLQHAGSLSAHCSVNVPDVSEMELCDDGDYRVLES
jgi:hypothetical protein